VVNLRNGVAETKIKSTNVVLAASAGVVIVDRMNNIMKCMFNQKYDIFYMIR